MQSRAGRKDAGLLSDMLSLVVAPGPCPHSLGLPRQLSSLPDPSGLFGVGSLSLLEVEAQSADTQMAGLGQPPQCPVTLVFILGERGSCFAWRPQ